MIKEEEERRKERKMLCLNQLIITINTNVGYKWAFRLFSWFLKSEIQEKILRAESHFILIWSIPHFDQCVSKHKAHSHTAIYLYWRQWKSHLISEHKTGPSQLIHHSSPQSHCKQILHSNLSSNFSMFTISARNVAALITTCWIFNFFLKP